MSEKQLKSRLEWQDVDWAKYFGCSVQQVAQYRKVVDDNFLSVVERNKKSKMYSLAIYRYDTAPSGIQRLQLMISSDKSFKDLNNAMQDANNIISCLELNDFWAGVLNIPKQAIQMALIRQN